MLDDARIANSFLDCPLKHRLVDMMLPFFTGHCVLPLVLREGADFLFYGKMGEEGVDFRLSHFRVYFYEASLLHSLLSSAGKVED